MELRPNPISNEEYHDHLLTGISLRRGQAELLVESPSGQRVAINLTGVRYLLGTDVLQGNIIDCIDCHAITPETAGSVVGELRATGSQYFTEKILSDIQASGELLGKYFVAVRPNYGAEIYVIAESVSEAAIT